MLSLEVGTPFQEQPLLCLDKIQQYNVINNLAANKPSVLNKVLTKNSFEISRVFQFVVLEDFLGNVSELPLLYRLCLKMEKLAF